jgi:hypothetical protein
MTDKIQQQIEKKEKELLELKEMLTAEQNKPESKWLKIPELKIEVETKLHTDMNMTKKIKVPKGCRLLTLSEWLFIYNNYKDKINYGGERPDEIVSQPIKENEVKYPYWNVWFRNLDDGSGLDGYDRDLYSGVRARGVRFARDMGARK